MIIESISEAYRVNQHDSYARRLDVDEVLQRSEPQQAWLVVHGEHDLPWWRRLLRRLKGIVTTADSDEHKQRLEGRR